MKCALCASDHTENYKGCKIRKKEMLAYNKTLNKRNLLSQGNLKESLTTKLKSHLITPISSHW